MEVSYKELKIKKMNELIKKINQADYEYYVLDNPSLSDKEYDDLYNELLGLERKTGIVIENSPTQKVSGECVEYLKKVKHTTPMLSAAKTKEVDDIYSFCKNQNAVCSYKLDGLTLVLNYKHGKLVQALTRGSGVEGEDVTHNAKNISNIPLLLHDDIDLEVRGECLISWDEFKRINDELNGKYSHPRNLAAGTLRQLDSTVSKQRRLSFVAFELIDISNDIEFYNYCGTLEYLEYLGFDVVPHELFDASKSLSVEYVMSHFEPEEYEFPVDGLIFKFDDIRYGKSLGSTAHHENNLIAFKWSDELYETTLRDIEWNTTRTGLINPVAVFDEVEIDGSKVSRATLHNVSYIKDLELGIGDKIQVYKSNMIIPKVHENLTRSNTYELPKYCPCCDEKISYCENENLGKVTVTLMCENDNCTAKLADKITHFVSKYGMNIVGFSKKTIETLIDNGFIKSILDIYSLKDKEDQLIELDGFGTRSVNQLLDSIEKSRNTDLEHFIYALGINGIGKAQSKIISNHFKTIQDFNKEKDTFDYTTLETFGNILNANIYSWFNNENNLDLYMNLLDILVFQDKETASSDALKGQTFVITGSLNRFKNRDEAKSEIQSLGGKVSGSVSKNTTYLVNNDINSTSSKNKKAIQLGVPIITEEELINILRGSK